MRQKVEEECDTVQNKEGLAWENKQKHLWDFKSLILQKVYRTQMNFNLEVWYCPEQRGIGLRKQMKIYNNTFNTIEMLEGQF